MLRGVMYLMVGCLRKSEVLTEKSTQGDKSLVGKIQGRCSGSPSREAKVRLTVGGKVHSDQIINRRKKHLAASFMLPGESKYSQSNLNGANSPVARKPMETSKVVLVL
jgi:hypothetical protein